jgi:hypothetical protein
MFATGAGKRNPNLSIVVQEVESLRIQAHDLAVTAGKAVEHVRMILIHVLKNPAFFCRREGIG